MDVDKIRREIERYTDTVRLFFSISDFFKSNGFEIHIEPTIKTIDGDKRPDIVFYDNGVPKMIADYKWSLKRREEYLVNELNMVYEKYSSPQLNGEIASVDVIALIPDTDCENLLRVIDSINKDLIIYSIKINDDEGYIEFKDIRGKPNYEKFTKILEKNGYRIPLNRYILTRIAFIREEPPLSYSAYIIWKAVYQLVSVNELYLKREVELRYDEVLEELRRQFPPWVKDDINQLTQGRLNKALKFLRDLGFLKVDKDKSKITVNLKRGSKIQDQLRYFVEKFVEREIAEQKADKAQKTLSDFFEIEKS